MNKNNIVVLIGPPGAGKGSLSKLLVKRFGWIQLSTGNLCREHIINQSEIGKEIDLIIKSGKLISDDLVVKMVEDWLLSHANKSSSIIFDGFPRTIEQAKALDKILSKINLFDLNIIKLEAADANLTARLSSRATCSNNKCQAVYSLVNEKLKPKKEDTCDECSSKLSFRSDDNEASILQRLAIYRVNENNIVNYFHDRGKIIEKIFMDGPLELIYQDFVKKLNLV